MVKLKIKSLRKGLFAPSVLPATSAKKPDNKTIKKLDELAKQQAKHPILKNYKAKTAKGGALKKPAKPNKERDLAIARAYEEYMHKMHLPAWGNTKLDADDKGFDGHADLKLATFVSEKLKISVPKLYGRIIEGNEKVIATILECAAFNAWEWSNFANRLWANTLQEQPPIRRVVAINLSDLIPCVNQSGVLDILIPYMVKDADIRKAFNTLGFCKTKVRLLPIIQAPAVSSTLYKLYDLLCWQKGSAYSVRGLVINAEIQSIDNVPRDVCIMQASNQRKSALKQLNAAATTGHRIIMPFAALKGDLKSIKEIKSSRTYSELVKTWDGLTPLISMPIDTKMELVSKVSKLGDILLT